MSFVWNLISQTAFVWVPIILGIIFWRLYMSYKVRSFISKKMKDSKYKMLEINIPRDVHRSPEAMEMVIDVLWHLGGGAMSWQFRVWEGSVLLPASLEIISVEGSIYFFIRAHEQIADLVKSTIYSQYPNAEVNEVDDYTKYVPNYLENEDSWDLYSAEFNLANEDFLPIKTYVDYGLDKAVGSLEEEQKIDPISPFLEFLGTLRRGEQIWVQFIVRADIFHDWRKRAKEYIKEVMGRAQEVSDGEPFQTLKLTHGEQEKIKAIERGLSKHAFETVIRVMYIAPKKYFNAARTGFFKNNIFKSFSSQYLNRIAKNPMDTGVVDWVWQDITGRRTASLKRTAFKEYVTRDSFYRSSLKYLNFFWYKKPKTSIFTSEELATLFHIPGKVSETGALERIEATKAQPPQNLPI